MNKYKQPTLDDVYKSFKKVGFESIYLEKTPNKNGDILRFINKTRRDRVINFRKSNDGGCYAKLMWKFPIISKGISESINLTIKYLESQDKED